MSADAKVWEDKGGWSGQHDLPCPDVRDHVGMSLVDVLRSIEQCMNGDQPMRWELRSYKDGLGLAGYRS